MSLSGLPDELIVAIVAQTRIGDLPEFALCDHRMRGIVAEQLEIHAKRLKEQPDGPVLRKVHQYEGNFGLHQVIGRLSRKLGMTDLSLRSASERIPTVLNERYRAQALRAIWAAILPSLQLAPLERDDMSRWDGGPISTYLCHPDHQAALGALTSLHLSGCRLKVVTHEIARLTSLWWLGLDHNHLSTLPDAIWGLTSLRQVNLSNNQLVTLPDAIARLTSLWWVGLDHNYLSRLPDGIGELTRLRQVNLSDNRLATLPDSIGGLTSLERVDLRNNQLATLPDSIGRLTRLECLNLNDNHLSRLPDSIGGLTRLEKLYLENNRFASIEALDRCPGRAQVGGNPIGITVRCDAGLGNHLEIRNSSSTSDHGEEMTKIGPDLWLLPMNLVDFRVDVIMGRPRQFQVVLVRGDGTVQPELGENRTWVPGGQMGLIEPRF